ncbi:MAG: guanylate kinase [Candidatus Melainabacteria bacterium]|nr:guanylate kinase [Candidatus Melainabacteria bacterium]
MSETKSCKNNLIIFTGPSGVGKGTIVKQLFSEMEKIKFSISCTTREMRPGEKEGVNYFFKSKQEFEEMIAAGEFLEYAEFVGNLYGTPKSFVDDTLASGNDVFLEIEVQGAIQVMKKCPEALTIFLIPPSLEELERRLRNRGTETEEVLQKRLEKAKEEMKYTGQFKYTVVNDDVDIAVRKLKALILGARA